jgi:hypothetical protein
MNENVIGFYWDLNDDLMMINGIEWYRYQIRSYWDDH